MSKGSRNRQQAREKIAQMRAEEARGRRRRYWLTGTGVVAVIAAAAVGITLAVGGGSPQAGTSTPQLKLASLSTLGNLAPAPSPGSPGSEGVPVPQAPALASTATAATGQKVDGISCQTSEQTIFHIHAHLTIFVNGKARQVPAGVGIPGARVQSSPQGPFISTGTCFYWLHTHAPDGIIHIESPVQRTYTLGNFFDEWGQPLSSGQVGPVKGHVTALYNGRVYQGNPRNIPLNAHAQIQLEVGTPHVAPEHISFPNGL
ncbi:MAG TPA: hypothetical protein VG253_15230 [Streptosporangiaceae bacterium]|nr:hypothetical protein [Streptosporangiaceae bacterium]